jgi:TorA maturation chaperone TorD
MSTAAYEGIGLAAAWRLLSLGFAAPTEERLAEVETLAETLFDLEPTRELADVLAAVRGLDAVDASTGHVALFGGAVLVAPYEGSYEIDPIRQGRQMADVAAFYRAFGASPHGPAADRPDFVGCELEFLSFLELRRLAALEGDEDAGIVDEIRDAFLTDHAGRWLPTFFSEVTSADEPTGLYRALAAYGSTVLDDELRRHRLEPSPPPARSVRSALDADTLECGAGA